MNSIKNKNNNKHTKSKSVFKFKKQTCLSSKDYIIPKHFVKPIKHDHLSIMSVAARGTTVLINPKICIDAGNLPIKLARNVDLLLITHGHKDHIQDFCNPFSDNYGKILIIFCPALNAQDIFNTIKMTHQINKGRTYSTEEISQHLKIYGVIRPNDNTYDGINKILCPDTNIPIVTLIRVGSIQEIKLSDKSIYAIKPFHCHHTVDTIGYGIYTWGLKLNKTINIPAGTVSEITPPKMTKADKKEYKSIKKASKRDKETDETKSSDNFIDHNLNRINFKTVNDFIDCLKISDTSIKTSITSHKMENGFVLDSIRRIEFTEDITINVFEKDKCILPKEVFVFFKEYATDMNDVQQIDTHHKVLTPHTMIFGDTAITVFSQKLVKTMLSEFPRIIIESTFLDGEDQLSEINNSPNNCNNPDSDCDSDCNNETKMDKVMIKKVKNVKRNLYLRLKEKKHIFLPELYYYFKKYPDTEFVLMHFSDRYDKETVLSTIDNVRLKYPNVYGAV